MGQNLYNYQPPKKLQEEVHFFLTKGRITLSAFLLRLLLTQCILLTYLVCKILFIESRSSLKILDIFILIFFMAFVAIQAAKRIHDTNKSGWYVFIPFYNLFLIFSKGSSGNNDYGINPNPQPQIKYFDELEDSQKEISTTNKNRIILYSIIALILSFLILFALKKTILSNIENNINKSIYYCLPSAVNVRSSKLEYSESNIIGTINYGDSVQVTDSSDRIWSKVKIGEVDSGFIHKKYLIQKADFQLLKNFVQNDSSFPPLYSENKVALLDFLKNKNLNKAILVSLSADGEVMKYLEEGRTNMLIYDKIKKKYNVISEKDFQRFKIQKQKDVEAEKKRIRKKQQRDRSARREKELRENRKIEEEIRQNTINNWQDYISVNVISYDKNTLGGFSNLQIAIDNESDLTISSCLVRYRIIKWNGEIFENRVVQFTNVPPFSTIKRSESGSSRGVRISQPEIIRIDF